MELEGIQHLARLMGSPVDGKGLNVRICCPMPVGHRGGVDTAPSLSIKVTAEQSPCRCFGCGATGTLLQVFAEALGENDPIVEFIRETDKGGLSAAFARIRLKKDDGPTDTPYRTWVRYVAECSRQVPGYLVERGVVRADVKKWMLGYDAERGYAVFPVWDEDGRLVGASRRAVSEEQIPKSLDTPGLPKQEVFYGEHLVDATRQEVHIVEGPLDAVFASRVLPNVLGMLGAHTGIGPVRLAKLRRWARVVTLVMDGDESGREAVYGKTLPRRRCRVPGLLELLRPYFVVRIAELPEGEDPASMNGQALVQAVKGASYLMRRARSPVSKFPSKGVSKFPRRGLSDFRRKE